MRHGIAVVVGLVALLICATLYAGEGEEAAEPKLAIPTPERVWDLIDQRPDGVQIGEVLEHEFVVRNDGDAPLQITEAKALDSFVQVEAPEGEIAPGETGTIKVVVNTVDLEPSQFASHIIVKSNDPDSARRPLVLTVKARLVPAPETLLVIDPQVYDVGVMRVGQRKELTFSYKNAGDKPFTVKPIAYIDKKRLTIVQNIDRSVLGPGAGKEFKLRFSPQAEDAGGKIEVVFRVSTDSEEMPGVTCRVQGYVEKVEGVQIIPRLLPGPTPRYVFRIVNNTEHPVQVAGTRGEEEFGSAVVEAGDEGTLFLVVAAPSDLSEVAFKVVPSYVAPEPEETEAVEGEGEAAGTVEEGGTEPGTVEDGSDETTTETEPDEGETPDSNGEDEGATDTSVEGG